MKSKRLNPRSISLMPQNNHFSADKDFVTLIKLLPLLDSNFDADRINYLLRDGYFYFTGVPFEKIDVERICKESKWPGS